MWSYMITEGQLDGIVRFAQSNPKAEFYMEHVNYGNDITDEFLSCTFYNSNESSINSFCISDIWDLPYGTEEEDAE